MQELDLNDPLTRESFEREILEAIRRAVRRALLRSKKLGYPIVDHKDGVPVWIQPEDIDVTDGECS